MSLQEEKYLIQTDDRELFQVQVNLNSSQSEIEILSRLLKSIKDEIHRQYGIPATQLKYRRIVDKQVSPEGILTILELTAVKTASGKPALKLCSIALPNGNNLDNMLLQVDLYPIDHDNQPLTPEKLKNIILETGILADFIDEKALENAVKLLHEQNEPLEDIVLAQGVPPEIGEDAKLDFSFNMEPDKSSVKQYMGSRKAIAGDVLCVKHPRIIGKVAGKDLFGKEIKPFSGRDFNLLAGNGTKMSEDGSKIYATVNGVAIVKKDDKKVSALSYTQTFPREVQLRIDPLTVIESSRTVEIVTKNSLEIQGTVQRNSNIVSEGEIFVLGNVEPDSKIHSGGDILIEGNIDKGSLIASKNIFAGGEVTESTLSAKGTVKVEGTLRNSRVVGENVEIDRLVNSTIVASKRVVIRHVEQDEAEVLSVIKVGLKEYQRMKVTENDEFLDYLKNDLNKMKKFFGNEIVKDVTYANLELMLLKTVKQFSLNMKMDNEKWEAAKKLMESIPSLKILINEVKSESLELLEMIEKQEQIPGEVIIKEKFQCPVRIEINSVRTDVMPVASGRFTLTGDKIVNDPWP